MPAGRRVSSIFCVADGLTTHTGAGPIPHYNKKWTLCAGKEKSQELKALVPK